MKYNLQVSNNLLLRGARTFEWLSSKHQNKDTFTTFFGPGFPAVQKSHYFTSQPLTIRLNGSY
jgi:hypothetical protein